MKESLSPKGSQVRTEADSEEDEDRDLEKGHPLQSLLLDIDHRYVSYLLCMVHYY